MMVRRLAYSVTCASAALVVTVVAAYAGPKAVLELFTSQGCSSCPPADQLLAQYSDDPDIVALSLAVNYWDYLGWKDTLALTGHMRRQQAYGRARGDGEVYTPQIVVNGVKHVNGSDKAAIESAMTQTRQDANLLSVQVGLTKSGGDLKVNVGDGKTQPAAEVWVCPLSHVVTVAIGRGENGGRTISYHNVVRRWIKLGDWSGHAEAWSKPIADLADASVPASEIDSVAVMLQSGAATKPGMILGAAMAKLH